MDYRSIQKPGEKEQVQDKCVLLNESIVDKIAKKLNYKVLVKLVEVTTPINSAHLEYMPVGHHYAILVYLTGDMRKFYYQGIIKLDQLFLKSKYISYVVLHLQVEGIRGKYFNNFDKLSSYYEDLHSKQISSDLHTFRVYEGSGAENKDGEKFKYYLKSVLNKGYNLTGSLRKLFLDKWNCIDFVKYLKNKLGS